MTNPITDVRTEVAEALTAAGLTAYDYVVETFTPPACIVLPDSPYIGAPVGSNPFRKPYSVNLQVLVIGSKGTNKKTATQIDQMLTQAINALDEDWEVKEVLAPQEVSLKGVTYLGSLVTLSINTSFEMEVI